MNNNPSTRDTPFILVREKQDPVTKQAKISIHKNFRGFDLTDYVLFNPKLTNDETMDKYVHRDDFVFYNKLMNQ